MRARFNNFVVPRLASAGGGCRLRATRDGWIALNLARPDDRGLLPALLCSDDFDPADEAAVSARIAEHDSAHLLAQGRILGLAIADIDERRFGVPHSAQPAVLQTAKGLPRTRAENRAPLVIDLSSLWAGPLAGQLLYQGGARVIKVESRTRPDTLRHGDPQLHAFLNQGKECIAVDLGVAAMRASLVALIRQADVVIEAARPRALRQLGIDAEALVAEVPGLVWMTITGHGGVGDAANWIGFGDDTAVAGGLSAALRDATGKIGFVGDALADPMTGILSAQVIAAQLAQGTGGRFVVSMSGVIGAALDESRREQPGSLRASLKAWAAAEGQPF
ncbi:MAG: CoA transferase [Novosphingobium sp.]|nr:CoA transferase [Novosphingobium sp.]